MAASPLSSILSPAQLAIVQQARAALTRPAPPAASQAGNSAAVQTQAPTSQQPVARAGRGQIVNIVV